MIFGNQTDNQSDGTQPSGAPTNGSFIVGGSDPADSATMNVPLPADLDDDATPQDGTLDQPATTSDDQSQPADDTSAAQSQDDSFSSIIAPADRDIPAVVHASVKSSLINQSNSYDDASDAVPADMPEDLLDLKQQALTDLGPLVGHLDQTPEEKFRTTMMLIQSTDNSALIKDAYAAAQAITDDKIRAQALLDVINEINYFTQQGVEPQE